MPKIMLINVTHSEESRVAIIHDGLLESFEIESFGREHLKSNLYKGVVHRIHPALEAAFVDIGGERDAFLPLDEICFVNLPRPVPGGMQGGDENGRRRRRIRDVLRPGEEVLVQITKEQFANKPPTLTTFYSLPGRYLVLLPGSEDVGISRRIEGEERTRLRGVVDRLQVPSGFGLIVRTAAGLDEEAAELSTDLAYLQRLWASIQEAAARKRGPALVYREHDIVLRTIRDFFTPDIDEIHIDNEEVFQRASEFLQSVLPGKERVLHLYQGDQPIFSAFDVESQIESIFKRRVQLRSGGSIVIDGTEALTAIDVNSGGSMRGPNPEETAFRTNQEAASEIARQLRLRDIGGLIVMDFIDMRDGNHIQEIERILREAMEPDKARHELGRISRFGLLEISRQRLRPAATATTYTACPMCEGHGAVRTTESAALVAVRKVHNRVSKGDIAEINVSVPPTVAIYLLNQKRDELARLEQRYSTRVQVILDDRLMPHQVEMEVRVRPVRVTATDVVVPGSVARAVQNGEAPSEPRRSAERTAPRGRTSPPRRAAVPANAPKPSATAGDDVAAPPAGEPTVLPPTPAPAGENSNGKKRRRRRGRRKSPALRAAIAIGEGLSAIGAHASALRGGITAEPRAEGSEVAVATAGNAPAPIAETTGTGRPNGRRAGVRRRGGRRAASRPPRGDSVGGAPVAMPVGTPTGDAVATSDSSRSVLADTKSEASAPARTVETPPAAEMQPKDDSGRQAPAEKPGRRRAAAPRATKRPARKTPDKSAAAVAGEASATATKSKIARKAAPKAKAVRAKPARSKAASGTTTAAKKRRSRAPNGKADEKPQGSPSDATK